MKFYIRQMLVLFLASLACLFYLEGNAAPPVKVTVTAAIPDSAVQGDTAEVEIDGTGFDAGSKARFLISGTQDDTQIDVQEVIYIGPGKLTAKIKVKDAALPIKYDIEVTTSSGRRGKGTTLFQVRVRVRTSDTPIQLGPANDVWPGPGDDNFGDDQVYGGDGDDMISGGMGNDHLYGESGQDVLDGEDGNDRLDGGPGYDLLFGGSGDDHFQLSVFGETKMDYADGGDGFDTLNLYSLEYADLDARTGKYTGYYFVVDHRTSTKIFVSGEFSNIEHFYMNKGGTYHGDEFDNSISSWGGGNVIYGHGGNDQLVGGAHLLDSGNSDYLYGGDGDDLLFGIYGDDYLNGGPGMDTFYIRDDLGHDVVEDFAEGEDTVSIYNSDICFQDLHFSLIEAGGDSAKGDTYITWPVGKKHVLNTVSITLLDVEPQDLSETDFDFTEDWAPGYSSDCP